MVITNIMKKKKCFLSAIFSNKICILVVKSKTLTPVIKVREGK